MSYAADPGMFGSHARTGFGRSTPSAPRGPSYPPEWDRDVREPASYDRRSVCAGRGPTFVEHRPRSYVIWSHQIATCATCDDDPTLRHTTMTTIRVEDVVECAGIFPDWLDNGGR